MQPDPDLTLVSLTIASFPHIALMGRLVVWIGLASKY
jgi:hypothetical protein